MYFRGKDYDNGSTAAKLDGRLVRILWEFAQPFRIYLLAALALILLGTAADLYRPYLMKVAIDDYIRQRNFSGLSATVLLYAVSIAVSAALFYFETWLLEYAGQRIIYNVRANVYWRLLYQKYSDMERQPVGRMVTRVTSDTDAVKDLYTDVLVAFASDCIVLLGIIVVMLVMNWRLALVSFAVIPVMVILALTYQKYARRAYRAVRETTSAVNIFLQESMNGISIVKAFARFARTEREYNQISKVYLAAGLQEMRTFALFRPLVDFIYLLAVILIIGYSKEAKQFDNLELGVLVAFLQYVEKFFWPIKDLAEKYNLLQSALAAAERVYDILAIDHPPEEPAAAMEARQFSGQLVFDNVWFAYEEPVWVLKGVSFAVPAGQFVGIAGLSGSGKTTLISLLLRFYEPQRGRILLDGVDIREIPFAILRRNIGVVFQDVHLFKGTVAENITLYNPEMPAGDMITAAQAASIHDLIMNLSQQYDTEVGYQGAFLSAGQRQLLSLARVLAHRSCVMVLDEATSSIDSKTEKSIQNALAAIARKQTLIVVAHRLSTIQQADQIIVLHGGEVVEQGTHWQLLQRKGFYERLYHSQ